MTWGANEVESLPRLSKPQRRRLLKPPLRIVGATPKQLGLPRHLWVRPAAPDFKEAMNWLLAEPDPQMRIRTRTRDRLPAPRPSPWQRKTKRR